MSQDDHATPTSGHTKRSSFDDSNTKTLLDTPPVEHGGYRASSLPRGARISTTIVSSKEGASSVVVAKEKKPVVVETKTEKSGTFITVVSTCVCLFLMEYLAVLFVFLVLFCFLLHPILQPTFAGFFFVCFAAATCWRYYICGWNHL